MDRPEDTGEATRRGDALVPISERTLRRSGVLAERSLAMRSVREVEPARAFVWPVVVVLDASARMQRTDPRSGRTLARIAADELDRFVTDLVILDSRDRGTRDEVAIEVIACGEGVISAFDDGPPRYRGIAALAEAPARIAVEQVTEEGEPREVRHPEWFDPRASGSARLRAGLFEALRLVHEPPRASRYQAAPWVLLVTAGVPEDGDAWPIARAILATTGEATDPVRLGVLHLREGAEPVEPGSDGDAEDDDEARALRALASWSPDAPIGYPDPRAPVWRMYARNTTLRSLLFGRWGIRPWDD